MMKRIKAFFKYLRRNIFRPYIKMLLMRIIVFYQKHFSKHTCLYEPTCSEYMLRSINNIGVIRGVCVGLWRVMRCNPLSKGGYDPAPEKKSKLKWII